MKPKFKESKSNIDRYKRFIVVDESNVPMSFDGDQFAYCTSSWWQDTQWPLRIYSKRKAMELIEKSNEYRRANKFGAVPHRLMPVKS